jgi:ABC-type ribose transport system, auxiliary component
MKKTPLLNVALSRLIASLGHGDTVVIGDAGLPVPPGVELIDLALTHGIPDFVSTLKVVLSEMQVESHVLAHEILDKKPSALSALDELNAEGALGGVSCSVMTNSKYSADKHGRLFVQANVSRTATSFWWLE